MSSALSPGNFAFLLLFPSGILVLDLLLKKTKVTSPADGRLPGFDKCCQMEMCQSIKKVLAEVLHGVLQGSNTDYKLVHLGVWVGKRMKNA